MKQKIVLLCCILLAGCSSMNDDVPKEKEISPSAEIEDFHFEHIYHGANSTDGFYHIVSRELDDGTTISNLRYFDYDSMQEIYLCDKPECKHKDETCSSVLGDSGFQSQLFVNGEHLYLIQNESFGFSMGGGEHGKTIPSGIIRMDLDGKNKKRIYDLEEGYNFERNVIVLANQTLFVPVRKEEYVAQANSSMGITTDQLLYAIDLEKGEKSIVCDMKFKTLEGAQGRNLVFKGLYFEEDMDQLLQDKEYVRYSNAFLSSTAYYQSYSFDTKELGDKIHAATSYATYEDGFLYVIDDDNQIVQTNMNTEESLVLGQLDASANYNIDFIKDGHIMISCFEKTDQNASYLYSYTLDIKAKSLQKFELRMSEPNTPFALLGEHEGAYFTIYDHDGVVEDTWAGTKQYNVMKEYYGFIDKQDFWNSVNSFTPLTALE